MGGVIIISTLDHTQLKTNKMSSIFIIKPFKMAKLETSIRAVSDLSLQKIQKIISMYYSNYIDNPNLLSELINLLQVVPTCVDDWTSSIISSETYRLYGKRSSANIASQSFLQSIRINISPQHLREKNSIDTQRLQLSHSEWSPAIQDIFTKLDRKVKEP